MSRRRLALAYVVLTAFIPFSSPGQPRPANVRGLGVGAYPLSFTHTAAWFASQQGSTKTVAALFYFEGTPGWPASGTKFHWEVSAEPATIEMLVGEHPITAKYWRTTGEIELQHVKHKLADGNVYLVSGIDTPHSVTKNLGTHLLTFSSDENPSIVLLQRDPEVWAAVTGRSPQEHPIVQNSRFPAEVVQWDAEGLRLVQEDAPEHQRAGCELLRRAALKGYPPSEYRLGYCYESGRGAQQDFAVANDWYKKAAAQGHVDAQYKLGHSYRVGRGAAIDLPTALSWYTKASENGDREASSNIAVMYQTGQGVAADSREAYRWFRRAAGQGDVAAQFETARRLATGEGVAPSPTEAYAWVLVLRALPSGLAPADSEQVEKFAKALESRIDASAKSQAEALSRTWMKEIAKAEMLGYSRQ